MNDKKIILDLGCGNKKLRQAWKFPELTSIKSKVIGIDIDKNSDADVIYDLNKIPYPFSSNTFDIIYSSDVLEHLDPMKMKDIMKELHRITRPNGKIFIAVPHVSCTMHLGNLEHQKLFSTESFRNLPGFKVEKMKLVWSSGKYLKWVAHPINFLLIFRFGFVKGYGVIWLGVSMKLE